MGREYGYTPRTVPTPLFIAVGLALFLLLMYLMLFLVSKKTGPAGRNKLSGTATSVPYYEVPAAAQPEPQPDPSWWETNARQEKEFRQDAYETFQRQDFDTDRRLEKIEQDKEFFKMQRSASQF